MITDMSKLKEYLISELAYIVRSDWSKINPAAVPYLDAMGTMSDIKDKYGADSGQSIVAYFLANAQTWKGLIAKGIKVELNRRLKLVK